MKFIVELSSRLIRNVWYLVEQRCDIPSNEIGAN